MEFEDYLEPEVAVTAVVAAAVFSPRARKLVRQGAVYGTAGVLAAGEAVNSFFKGFGHGLKHVDQDEVSTKGAHPSPEMQPQEVAGGQEL
jgi:hypothetical protein